jgi:hypothetical protein
MDTCTLDAVDAVYVSCSGCSGCNIRNRRFGLPWIPRNGAHLVTALTVVVDSYTRSPPSGVQHDGGPATLGSFLRAGALDQLNLTLERGPGPLRVCMRSDGPARRSPPRPVTPACLPPLHPHPPCPVPAAQAPRLSPSLLLSVPDRVRSRLQCVIVPRPLRRHPPALGVKERRPPHAAGGLRAARHTD